MSSHQDYTHLVIEGPDAYMKAAEKQRFAQYAPM
jgi:hypothetical protein